MPPTLSAIADGQNLRSVMTLYIRIANRDDLTEKQCLATNCYASTLKAYLFGITQRCRKPERLLIPQCPIQTFDFIYIQELTKVSCLSCSFAKANA
jgi:hypothetical protein